MTLDIVETISSTLSRVASKASLGVAAYLVGLLLILVLGFTAAGAATMISPVAGVLVGLITALVYIAGAASLTVGSLRAFDQQDIEKGMFTENILWPFLRITGSNIVLQAFAFMALYAVVYPIMLLTIGASGMMAGSMGTTPQMDTAGYAALGLAGGLAVAAALYVFSALSISLPKIAVNNERMFESLDSSVQDTRGSRPRIVVSMLPFGALLIGAMASLFYLGEIVGLLVYVLLGVLAALYWLALLTELNDRL